VRKRFQGLAIALIVIVIVFVYSLSVYNGIVRSQESVQNKWSLVENQLQRRADLIPNLVNTVKGYAKHEKDILEKLAEARSKLIASSTVAQKAQASDELSSAISRLLAIVENYPDLKANTTFIQLMDELSGTENRLAVARMDYNNEVKKYNTKIKVFPNVIIARLFGFEPKEYFKASNDAQKAPNVDFSD